METEKAGKSIQGVELDEEEENLYGLSFHKWPFLIAAAVTLLFYLIVFLFVDPNPPHFDPSELPPPPSGG